MGSIQVLSESQGSDFDLTKVRPCWQGFLESSKEHPDNIAVVSTHQPSNLYGFPSAPLEDDTYSRRPYLRWTYTSLTKAIGRLQNGLRSRGLLPGSTVVTFIPNIVENPVIQWTTYLMGCVHVPINPRNLKNQTEVVHMIETAIKLKSSEKVVVVASDFDVAKQVDTLNISIEPLKIVVGDQSIAGWESIWGVMQSSEEVSFSDAEDNTVCFTSGTTSLPKGCHWSQDTLGCCLETRRTLVPLIHTDKSCIVVPNNHALGALWQLMPHCVGATVIYPGSAFEPRSMMQTLQRERVTHTALVPTMIHALLGAKAIEGGRLDTMKCIMIGGSTVSPEVLQSCVKDLGSEAVENGYGMTECVIMGTGPIKNWNEIVRDGIVAVGKPMPGVFLKVCAANSNAPLPRGQVGELHFSASFLIRGYVNKQSDDFYEENGRKWFKTGDQARMDYDGWIFVTGRFKEMIIRGGENISPAAIEFVLKRVPDLSDFDVQIVGAIDKIAGEVPVAVVETANTDTSEVVKRALLEKMGPIYVPDEIITWQQLGITELPKTMAGKIQKLKLAALVKEYRERQDQGVGDVELRNEVKKIWKTAIGYDIDENTSIADFADSITVMRVRDRILKQTGKGLSLSEIANTNTIAGQIELLEKQVGVKAKPQPKMNRREGPPSAEDIVHLADDPELFDSTKAHIEKMLRPHGFAWDDVEDVMPAYDFGQVLAQTNIFDSWNLKFSFTFKGKDTAVVRKALEATLRINPILGSFLFWDEDAFGSDIALHVQMRHDQRYLDTIIKDVDKVKTLNDVKQMTASNDDRAKVPGQLLKIWIMHVEETDCAAIVMDCHHAVMDASYSLIFQDDFNSALGGQTLDEHIDYKTWADSFFTLRTSYKAQIAINWHMKRLKGLPKHEKAIYPPDLRHETEYKEDGYFHSFEAPFIGPLRRQHCHLTAPVIVKSAVALWNIYRTGYTHALFANLEAARTKFPFIPKSLEKLDSTFEATNVAGPTIEAVTNVVELKSGESVIEFLTRMQDDQNGLSKYASAPLSQLVQKGGDLVLEILKAQLYNWVPGMGTTGTSPYEHTEMVSLMVRPELRLAFNCGLGGPTASTVFVHVRGSAFDKDEAIQTAKELEAITLWLTNEKNWGKEVGGFRRVFDTDE